MKELKKSFQHWRFITHDNKKGSCLVCSLRVQRIPEMGMDSRWNKCGMNYARP
jgi:hypothetical protein